METMLHTFSNNLIIIIMFALSEEEEEEEGTGPGCITDGLREISIFRVGPL